MILIDLQKAYDSVDRQKLMDILERRAKTDQDNWLVEIIR